MTCKHKVLVPTAIGTTFCPDDRHMHTQGHKVKTIMATLLRLVIINTKFLTLYSLLADRGNVQVHRRLVNSLWINDTVPQEKDPERPWGSPWEEECKNIDVFVCLRIERGSVVPCSLSCFIPLLPLLTCTHDWRSGAHPHPCCFPAPTSSLFWLSVGTGAGGWLGCSVCLWCDAFEQCLPPGDERVTWGSGVVCERQRQREVFAPRGHRIHQC